MYGKRLNLFFVILLILLMISILVAAPTGKIEGYVLDSQTGDALPGANVVIEGTGFGTASDLNGKFSLPQVPVGNYQLSVTYMGYEDKVVSIEVSEGETTTQVINMDFRSIQGEVITVTAQVEGQVQAINQQLSSNTISNIVSKARIKEMPDVNAAESIGRLPGVSINRSGGEANQVAIRGLSPKYNLITVNGVRLPSASTSQGNSLSRYGGDRSGNDRTADLSLISSNMIDGIELKKANTADMDADAIGGTVDLKLKDAPDGMRYSLAVQGGYNKLQDYYGNYSVTGNFSNRFFDSKLGLIVNFNIDNYDRSADKLDLAYDYYTQNPYTYSIQNLRMTEEEVKRGRIGGNLLWDYKIPSGRITSNMFYNQLSWDGFYRINRLIVTSGSGSESNRHYYDFEDRGGVTDIFTGSLGIQQDFGWMSYDVGVSHNQSLTDNPNEHTWRFVQEAEALLRTDFPPDSNAQVILKYANVDTGLTRTAEVYTYDTKREEKETGLQFNLKFPLSLNKYFNGYIKTGAKFRWLDRMNDVERVGRNGLQYGGTGNEMLTHLDEAYPEWGVQDYVDEYGWLPITPFLEKHERDNFLDGDYPVGFSVDRKMMKQVEKALEAAGDTRRYSIASLQSDYDGKESYQAAYLMGEFKITDYFTFIPGVRYERDESTYNGMRFKQYTLNNIEDEPIDLLELSTKRENDFWLPQIHLIAAPTDWMKIRLARTETLTRPDFLQYAPITQSNNNSSYVWAANSQLKPSRSTNWDGSVSIYEKYIGLFTASVFNKDVEDLIFQVNYKLNEGVPVLEGWNIPNNWVTYNPSVDTWVNNPGDANYKGIELDWQTHFWYLPSFLNGLVFSINYTNISSEMEKLFYYDSVTTMPNPNPPPRILRVHEMIDSSRTTRLPDQPKHILNATLGYDYRGFSARLSFLFQTDRVTYVASQAESDNFSADYARWDLTLQQKIMDNFQIYANFTNLNNRPDKNYIGNSAQPTYIEYYGFTMDVGLRYKFGQ
jgi:TonB-dependent receptor